MFHNTPLDKYLETKLQFYGTYQVLGEKKTSINILLRFYCLHIPPDGDAGFAFFRGAFFAVVFEFSVAADGDDGVFF